jgi:hypothetical protein
MAPTGLLDGIELFVAVHLGLSLPTGALVPSIDGLLANSKLRAVFHGRSAHAALALRCGAPRTIGAGLSKHVDRRNVGLRKVPVRGGAAAHFGRLSTVAVLHTFISDSRRPGN